MKITRNSSWILLFLLLAAPGVCGAQTNLIIYSDSLTNGWLDYSYNVTENYQNTSPVHSGVYSIAETINSAYGGIQLYHSPFTNTAYDSVSFWINGGASGGQQLQMYGNLGTGPTAQGPRFHLNTLAANTWQQYTVPLSVLGVGNVTNFSGFAIQDAIGSAEPTFYLDDIQLVVSPLASGGAHLTANAGQTIRTADSRWFGMNAAQWDAALNTPGSVREFTNMGTRIIRLPGGSDSDLYQWLYNREYGQTWTWESSLADFISVITNANAQAMTTVNYGTGSSSEAAAWVAYCNAATTSTVSLGTDRYGMNWQTAGYWASLRAAAPLSVDDGHNFLRINRASPLGFKYWEIGNEVYGSWETDSNAVPHDPYTYASNAVNFITLMKAVDPTVKIGVVVTPGDDNYANYFTHPATNLVNGSVHYGWTPVLLSTLTSLGVTPDFLIHHVYPQNPGGENDAFLLQASANWANDATTLRQEIVGYVGNSGTNIELVCTENNSVSSNPGKQSTSLVNGLYLADSLAALMQTEFNGFFWWNFRNGGVTTGNNNSASLYGWREYGDYAVTEGTTNYPPYYAERLLQKFIQPGDSVIAATNDYYLLSAYAARRQDGALTLLAINKDPVNTITGKVAIAGFTPSPGAILYSYGIPQDNAAETGIGSQDISTNAFSGASTNFSYAFPPYSANVFFFSPAPVTLTAQAPVPGQIVLHLQTQPGVPNILELSTDLFTWTPISTNTSTGYTLTLTNPIPAAIPGQFYRAVWIP
jgi:hypothetical protein